MLHAGKGELLITDYLLESWWFNPYYMPVIGHLSKLYYENYGDL